MRLKLYGDTLSPCVRATIITAEILKIDLEYIPIDLLKFEHKSSEHVKLNPLGQLPFLDDNGFTLGDSHAIMMYLADKYSTDNSIYPKDLQKRAIVHRMLYYEASEMFALHKYIGISILRHGSKGINNDILEKIENSFDFLNITLEQTRFVAGDHLTIADLSVWTTISNIQIYLELDSVKYPKLAAYMNLMETLPLGDLNKREKTKFKEIIEKKLKQTM